MLSSARCVRGTDTSLGAALKPGAEVVEDPRIGRQWQRKPGAAATWQGALAQCEGLSLGGQQDWRLPSVKELAALWVLDGTPELAGAFSGLAGVYWTSTPSAGSASSAWSVGFGGGLAVSPMAGSQGVLCVR